MLKRDMNIADYDPALFAAMEEESTRQEEHIELIASENYTSPRVMEAQGSQLTNKYAEVTQVNVITAAANTSIKPKPWRLSVRVSCLVVSMPTFSLTRAHKQIVRSTWHC